MKTQRWLRPALFLYRNNRPVSLFARVLLLGSIAFGVSALVVLRNFSDRIEATVLTDSKKLLTADFQIRARRAIPDRVLEALQDMGIKRNEIIRQTDFISSSVLPDGNVQTTMLRALEGAYPFYGEFISEPQISIEDLAIEPSVIVEDSLQARGFEIGDPIRIGQLDFKIKAFLKEEPQALASVFSVGPRMAFHQKFLEKTGLSGEGSRARQYLLIKSPMDVEEFKEEFRSRVNEPHWRIRTAERANQQAQNVISRLRGFLSLVALCALFLGGLGIFTIYRGQLLQRLPYELSLRCLGFSRRALMSSYLLQALENALIGGLLGYLGGALLEQQIARYAMTLLDVNLASVPFAASAPFAALITLSSVLIAVIFPVIEALKVPVAQALRSSQLASPGLNWRELSVMLSVVVFLVFYVVSFNWVMAGLFCVSLAVLCFVLAYLSRRVAGLLQKASGALSFAFRFAFLNLLRTWSRARFFVIAVGLSVFVMLSVLFIGNSLREQIDLSQRIGVPNLFLLGVSEEQKPEIREDMPGVDFVPIIQSRLLSLKGEDIVEEYVDDQEQSARRFLTREYTITKRSDLSVGERLVEGQSLFPPPIEGKIRVSLEQRFAQRIDLSVGDHFVMQIAGVPLEAQVVSLRKVDWWNFQPNFFIVVHSDDLQGAPFNFVGFSDVPTEKISDFQGQLQAKFPNLSVIDGEAVTKRVSLLLERLSFAVLSLGLFSVFSCALVFIGMLITRREEKLSQIALFKALGASKSFILKTLNAESVLLLFLSSATSLLVSVLFVALLCRFALEIPFHPPHWGISSLVIVGLPLLLSALSAFLMRSYLRQSPADALRASESV